MKIAVFSAKKYDREFLSAANASRHELRFFEPHLSEETAGLAGGIRRRVRVCERSGERRSDCNAGFVRRAADRVALRRLQQCRSLAAKKHGITVVRVPAYSPYAVAEHTIALMLALNRKLHRAYNRVREGNFALDGLLGFDMHGKTVGVIGTGQIGTVVAANSHRIRLSDFGLRSISKCDAVGLSACGTSS